MRFIYATNKNDNDAAEILPDNLLQVVYNRKINFKQRLYRKSLLQSS